YTSVKIALDVAVLALAFALAYFTRFFGPFEHEAIPELRETLKVLTCALIAYPVTFHQARLYFTNRNRTHIGEVFEIFKATITATLILVAVTYFSSERYSRLTLGIFVCYAFIAVSANRL